MNEKDKKIIEDAHNIIKILKQSKSRETTQEDMEFTKCPKCDGKIIYFETTQTTKIFNPISRKLNKIDTGGSIELWGYHCNKCGWTHSYTEGGRCENE